MAVMATIAMGLLSGGSISQTLQTKPAIVRSTAGPRHFAGGLLGGFLPTPVALRKRRTGESVSVPEQKRRSRKRRNVARHKAHAKGRR